MPQTPPGFIPDKEVPEGFVPDKAPSGFVPGTPQTFLDSLKQLGTYAANSGGALADRTAELLTKPLTPIAPSIPQYFKNRAEYVQPTPQEAQTVNKQHPFLGPTAKMVGEAPIYGVATSAASMLAPAALPEAAVGAAKYLPKAIDAAKKWFAIQTAVSTAQNQDLPLQQQIPKTLMESIPAALLGGATEGFMPSGGQQAAAQQTKQMASNFPQYQADISKLQGQEFLQNLGVNSPKLLNAPSAPWAPPVAGQIESPVIQLPSALQIPSKMLPPSQNYYGGGLPATPGDMIEYALRERLNQSATTSEGLPVTIPRVYRNIRTFENLPHKYDQSMRVEGQMVPGADLAESYYGAGKEFPGSNTDITSPAISPYGITKYQQALRSNLQGTSSPPVPLQFRKQVGVPLEQSGYAIPPTLQSPVEPPFLPNEILQSQAASANPGKSIGAAEWAANTPRNYVPKMGEAGKQFGDAFTEQMVQQKNQSGAWHTLSNETLKGVTPNDFAVMTDMWEGRIPYMGPLAEKAQMIKKGIIEDASSKLSAVDPSFKPIENWWRHVPSDEFQKSLKTDAGKASYKKYLETQGYQPHEVNEITSSVIANADDPIRVGSPFAERENLIPPEFVRRDEGVLRRYIDSTAKRLSQVENFGKSNEKLKGIIDSMSNPDPAAQQNNVAILTDLLKRHELSQQPSTTSFEKGMDNVRQANTVMLMGPRSTLTNYLQRYVNPLLVKGSGAKNYIKANAALYTKAGKEFATRAGTVDGDMVTALNDGFKSNGWGSKWLKTIGFNRAEKGNRIVGANLGKFIAQDMFKSAKKGNQFGMQVLEGLGINVPAALKRGTLTPDELYRAAAMADHDMNFGYGLMDVPAWMTGAPLKKAQVQFMKGGVQQTQAWANLIKDSLKNPINSGKNLIYASLATVASGGLHKGISDTVKGKNPINEFNENPGLYILKSLGSGPGIGHITNVVESANRGATGIPSMIAGPSAGLAGELGYDAVKLLQGKPGPVKKTIGKRIPLLPPSLNPLLQDENN